MQKTTARRRPVLREDPLEAPNIIIASDSGHHAVEADVANLGTAGVETKNFRAVGIDNRAKKKGVRLSAGDGQVHPGESARDGQGGNGRSDGIAPDLTDVPETMLWALHNRAGEARRSDGVLVDPDCVRIHEALTYDFARCFGDPVGSLAVRAASIDRALRCWLKRHPDGLVVSLGEGLETQVRRVDNGRMRWLSVDLPEAIRLRERFLSPTERFHHIEVSALSPAWMDAVDPLTDVFIVAQGLLMYLEPEMVQELFSGIADRFPGAEVVFDVVPRWFSRLTLLGLNQTGHYRLPPMPWGINRDEVEPTLRRWHSRFDGVTFLDYGVPRGLPLLFADMIHHIPIIRHEVPSLVHVTITSASCQSAAISNEAALSATAPANSFEDPSTIRKTQMASSTGHVPDADTIGDMFVVFTRNAGRGGDLAMASGQIVAKRVALGMAAAINPQKADRAEFARMLPEKVEAFSAASMIMLHRSSQVNRQMTRLATDEVMTTARASIAMVGSSSPVALAEAQGRFALAWFNRAASNFVTMGMLALDAQDAVMAPLRRTVVANATRLGRS
jgi:O-methyltransferase involved in polyketide biosynthesis